VLAGDGLWVYAGNPKLEPFPGAVPLDVLPETLQEYFRAAFVDGARRPEDRPSAQQWVTALERLRESLVHPPRRARPPAAVSAASPPGRAPTRRVDPDGTGTGPGPAPSTVRMAPGPSDVRRPAPPRHRNALRVAAWATLAVAGIGGGIGVAGATSGFELAGTETAGTASGRAAPPPPPVRQMQDPTEALERLRADDASTVEELAESWVAQLSARPAGAGAVEGTVTDAAILAGHDAMRKRYPAAVLLRSTDWNYDGDLWITVIGERFATAEEANAWCDTHRIVPRECFAKKLSHSGAVEGSERYRG
jgi:hypothetical protein